MNIKFLLSAALATGLTLPFCPAVVASPITVTDSTSPNAVIPDNNLSGLASSITMSSGISSLTDVQVTVDVVGAPTAWNGDYYAYLQYSSGLVVLLNNLGASPGTPFGSAGNGFDITFSDAAANVSTAPGLNTPAALSGTYAPQAGSLDSTFGGLDPDGVWTLFIADREPGGVGELASWSLQVTGNAAVAGVPDRGNTFALFLASAGLLFALKHWADKGGLRAGRCGRPLV
jgi:subtilisin-like proprotein convertase family protein